MPTFDHVGLRVSAISSRIVSGISPAEIRCYSLLMPQPYTPPPQLTDNEYWSELEIVSNEVFEANYFYQVMEEMNELVLNDRRVWMATNRQADFWQAHRASNQVALFMSLWRIFDTNENAKSVHRIIRITRQNLQIFSKASLSIRKGAKETNPPWWLDVFMQQTWEPTTAADLKFLKDALKPHAALFATVYEPIRHNIYGHRLMSNSHAQTDLFPQTNRKDIGTIINFLQTLISDLEHLYLNGRKPALTGDFTVGNIRIRETVRKVMNRLAENENDRQRVPE
jgi:hypothetical protein